MPTEKPRVTITISEDQLQQVDEYRFGKKMKNQTQAILSLVQKGLDAIECGCEDTADEIKKAPEISLEGKDLDEICDLIKQLPKEQWSEIKGYLKHLLYQNEATETAKANNRLA